MPVTGPLLERAKGGKNDDSAWDNVPEIGGSKWGFIGLMAGLAIVVILAFIIAICCCVSKRKKNKRLRYASQGNDLSTIHPTPSFNRSGGRQFQPLRGHDDAENEAFMARSPRHSFAYEDAAPRSSAKHLSGYSEDMTHQYPPAIQQYATYSQGPEYSTDSAAQYGSARSHFAEPDSAAYQHTREGTATPHAQQSYNHGGLAMYSTQPHARQHYGEGSIYAETTPPPYISYQPAEDEQTETYSHTPSGSHMYSDDMEPQDQPRFNQANLRNHSDPPNSHWPAYEKSRLSRSVDV